MHVPDVISLTYFVTCAVYFLFGMLVLSRNFKSAQHWLFFFCCMDMSLWAFTFTIGNVAVDEASCLLWRRLGSIGWGSMFSYFVHYVLLLTGNRLLKRKWIYPMLYVPALINIFLYGICTKTAVASYNLQYTYSGWINVAGNTALDWYYNAYYVGFSIAGIALLLHHGIVSRDAVKRKQVFVIGFSYTVTVILGTLTEYVVNAAFQVKVPQLAPMIILIPVTMMLHYMKETGFMSVAGAKREPEPNQILSDYEKTKLYFYLSIIYVMAGFLNFGVQFFSRREPVGSILLFSSVILGFGFASTIVQTLRIKAASKQILANILLVVTIPVMVNKHIEASPFYSWVVPVILMLMAIAFDQRQLLYCIGGATLVTLVLIWIREPVMHVTFSAADHLTRIAVLFIILWVVLQVNRIYVGLINDNKEKVRQGQLVNQVANMFIKASDGNLSQRLEEAMELCGVHFGLDWIHILFLSSRADPQGQSVHHQWCAPGVRPLDCSCEKEMLKQLSLETDPERMTTEGYLLIDSPDASEKDSLLKQLPRRMGMKSVLIKALQIHNDTIGFLCFGTAARVMQWKEPQQQTANLLGHLITDIWSRVEAERGLRYQATHDALTALPNRSTFVRQLDMAIGMAGQTGTQVGVLFLDMDSFKAINDSIGHESGDEVLQQIGRIVKDSLRPEDLVARFGGDEFLVMVPQMQSFEQIAHIADRIIGHLETPMLVQKQEFHMTASMGIAVYPFDGLDAHALIKHADLAMYKAKAQGKNQYVFCTEDMKQDTIRMIKLTEELFRALERSELQLRYQPQVHAASGIVVGAEALLRWFHPEHGMISPGLFIPIAEQTGLIVPIGEWVLRTACRQCVDMIGMGIPATRMAVNVSMLQLQRPDFVSLVSRVLEETGLEPRLLELEITESTAVSEDEAIVRMLEQLKALGVSIAIDDFGTEYSSLSRLCVMPIDRIKLDIQFIRSIGRSAKDNAIIQGIVGIAHSLSLSVIAEGVETKEQLDFLIAVKCDEIQGYLFSPPVPSDELERILRLEKRLEQRAVKPAPVIV